MELARLLEDRRPAGGAGCAVAVGTFDGVHLGHQGLASALARAAEADGLESVALAFRRSPAELIRPGTAVKYLCDEDEKAALLRAAGVGSVVGLQFTEEVRGLTAGRFMAMLVKHMGARVLAAGSRAVMGNDRLGGDALAQAARQAGLALHAVREEDAGGASSSAIRKALAEGRVEDAAAMLGRNYALGGEVVRGDQLGRKLGVPTVNLNFAEHLAVPRNGVYAAMAELEGGAEWAAATSIGIRPTVDSSGRRTVEAHLVGYSGDLYGQRVRLRFVKRLRDEEKLSGLEELKEYMQRDIEATARLLGG